MIPTSIDGTDITGATIDGTDVTEITVDGDTVFTAVPAGAFDIQQLSFETSFDPQNFRTGNTTLAGDISADGTHLFEIDNNTTSINQYDLSTPYELSSVSFDTSVSTFFGEPGAITFSNDGTKMFEGNLQGGIREYALSTPFDVSSKNGSGTVTQSSINTEDIAFNDDGSAIYVVGPGGLEQINLSNNFDISSVASRQTSTPPGDDGIDFSKDGTVMHNADFNSDEISQISLSTPFDITTQTGSAVTIPTKSDLARSIAWNSDGTRLYEFGQGPPEISQYNII